MCSNLYFYHYTGLSLDLNIAVNYMSKLSYLLDLILVIIILRDLNLLIFIFLNIIQHIITKYLHINKIMFIS